MSASTKRRTRTHTVEHPDTATAAVPRAQGLHVKVDRAALVAALTEAKAVIPVRAAAPVLAGVHLSADASAGTLVLVAFDYKLSVRIRLEAAVFGSGRLLLHGRDLYELVKKTSGSTVEIRAVGAKAVVKPGNTEYTVQTLPVQDYPALPDMPVGGGTVFVRQFLDAVKKVTTAAGIDDTIPMLTGVRIEFHGDTMALIATDRFRLAVAEIPWFPDEPVPDRPPLLIPAKILKVIVGRWDKATGRLRIGVDHGSADGLAGFALDAETYTTRLMSGEFVKYRSLFPAEYARRVVAETTVLHAAAARVAVVAGRTSPVKLTAFPGAVVLEAGGGDDARGLEVVPAQFDGAPFSVSCNPAYLLEGLAALGQGFASLNITTPTKPLVLAGHRSPRADDASGYRYLMMPLRTGSSRSSQDRYRPGRMMDLGQAIAYMADHGTVCKTTAAAAATVAATEATAALDLLEPPPGFADRAGAGLMRNVVNESAAFTAWAAASEPTCPAGVCEPCDTAARTPQPEIAGRR